MENLIVTETGENVENSYLEDILEISNNESDFLNKVNYGITENFRTVGQINDMRIKEWYNERK